MFGLLKPKLTDPVIIRTAIVIDAPREAVFDLLDFASPSNVLRALGYGFAGNVFGTGRYAATHGDAPGVTYHFEVDDYVANIAIGFRSWLEGERVKREVTGSRSDYVLVGLDEERCRLELVETGALRPGVSRKAADRAKDVMTELVEDHLRRVKVLAEYGADADVAA